MPETRDPRGPPLTIAAPDSAPSNARRRPFIGRLPPARYSLHSEASLQIASRSQLAQHIMQDAAVSIVFELIQRIDAAEQRNAAQRTIAGHDLGGQLLARLQIALQPAYRHRFIPLQPHRLPRRTVLKGQPQHAHADQIGAVDALEALANHCADADKPRSFRGPVASRAVAVFAAADNT